MYKQAFNIFNKYPALTYLDSAATTQKPQIVIDAISNYYTEFNANVHRGNYALSEKATELYEEARVQVKDFINAQNGDIIFTSGTTASINQVAISLEEYFKTTVLSNSTKPKAIFVTELEHHSNLLPWQRLAKQIKAELLYLKINSDFQIDIADLITKLDQYHPLVLAITNMSNVTGSILDVEQIIEIFQRSNPEIFTMVDAAQAIAHMPIDVIELGCSALAFSGHKIFAPTGIGVLFLQNQWAEKLQPCLLGGGMIRKVLHNEATWDKSPAKFEAGTPNIEGAIGLKVALKYVNSIGMDLIKAYEEELNTYFLYKINMLPQLKLFGNINLNNRGPVYAFSIAGAHAHDVATILSDYNVAVRAGHHCTQILHREVLKTVSSVRASFSIYNTKEDIDNLFNGLNAVIEKLKLI